MPGFDHMPEFDHMLGFDHILSVLWHHDVMLAYAHSGAANSQHPMLPASWIAASLHTKYATMCAHVMCMCSLRAPFLVSCCRCILVLHTAIQRRHLTDYLRWLPEETLEVMFALFECWSCETMSPSADVDRARHHSRVLQQCDSYRHNFYSIRLYPNGHCLYFRLLLVTAGFKHQPDRHLLQPKWDLPDLAAQMLSCHPAKASAMHQTVLQALSSCQQRLNSQQLCRLVQLMEQLKASV